MWLDLDGLRAVHACWDEVEISRIAAAHKDHGGGRASRCSPRSRSSSKARKESCQGERRSRTRTVTFAPRFALVGTWPRTATPTAPMRFSPTQLPARWDSPKT
jgi:hypothetical protein